MVLFSIHICPFFWGFQTSAHCLPYALRRLYRRIPPLEKALSALLLHAVPSPTDRSGDQSESSAAFRCFLDRDGVSSHSPVVIPLYSVIVRQITFKLLCLLSSIVLTSSCFTQPIQSPIHTLLSVDAVSSPIWSAVSVLLILLPYYALDPWYMRTSAHASCHLPLRSLQNERFVSIRQKVSARFCTGPQSLGHPPPGRAITAAGRPYPRRARARAGRRWACGRAGSDRCR